MTTTQKKRRYTLEFKEEAVRLIREQGYSGLGEKAALQKELGRLKKEDRRLRMEREILKKAAAFFAKESS